MPDKKQSDVFFVPASYENEGIDLISRKLEALTRRSGILDAIGKDDYVGIKLHFGERENAGFIRPPLVKKMVELCREHTPHVALIETNTIYVGPRSNAISHLELAYSHGFTYDKVGAPIIIADGITGRSLHNIKSDKGHVKNARIAAGIADLDFILGLAHVTGHCQTGLASAIKNIGMGCASRAGKLEQHSTVLPQVTFDKCTGCGLCMRWCPKDAIRLKDKKAAIAQDLCIGCGECTVACRAGAIEIKWNESVKKIQEKMAEYARAALAKKKRGFLNFLMKITKDCDCMAKDDPRIIDDIGIIASENPVAIDKATTDILLKKGGCDRLKVSYPNIDWNIQLDYSSKIGLGSKDYRITEITGYE